MPRLVIPMDEEQYAIVKMRSKQVGLTMTNWVRSKLGFAAMQPGRPRGAKQKVILSLTEMQEAGWLCTPDRKRWWLPEWRADRRVGRKKASEIQIGRERGEVA